MQGRNDFELLALEASNDHGELGTHLPQGILQALDLHHLFLDEIHCSVHGFVMLRVNL